MKGGAGRSLSAIHGVLAISIATNLILIGKLYYPNLADTLVRNLQSPPDITSGDQVRGSPNARNTVIVYTDYECPFCAQLNASMLELLKDSNSRWVYRHFPLGSHALAQPAAEAAECAGEQGKFWEYSDSLFGAAAKFQSDSAFYTIAGHLKLDENLFSQCFQSGKFRKQVYQEYQDGVRRRITGTPTFFVNGKRFDGALPVKDLRALLDDRSDH